MLPKDYAKLLYETLSPYGTSPEGGENKPANAQYKILRNFKNILIRNKETYLAPAIGKEFGKIRAQKEQDDMTYIASAQKLSVDQRQQLERTFIEPREFSENPSLVGGIAVRQQDIVFNATLRKKIEFLKSSI